MTTIIAVRNVGLYSDSLCTFTVNFRVKKLYRVGEAIFGAAGNLEDMLKFRDWLDNEGEDTCEAKNFSALVMNRTGIYMHDGGHPDGFQIREHHYAVGTGAVAAMAAMEAGADPYKALKIAAKFDTTTGGKTQFLPFKR